jgi:chorismate dehydratase
VAVEARAVIRLGHIDYSNCVPVHARLLSEPGAAGVEIVTGVPADLNARLAAGELDVAPASSIEYVRHRTEYRLLPDLGIGSDGAVRSIRLESAVAVESLGGARVCVPGASATSVVLLRILLEVFRGLQPRFEWYDQDDAADPIREGAAAVLRIGDVALRRSAPPGRIVLDLGADWLRWTGLPFVYAVWQARREVPAAELGRLYHRLRESRDWFGRRAAWLAEQYAPRFRLAPAVLLGYWSSLRYDLDERMQRGLLEFYRLAERVGEPAAPALEWAVAPAERGRS